MKRQISNPETGGPLGHDPKTMQGHNIGGLRAGKLEQWDKSSDGLVDILSKLTSEKKVAILKALNESGIDPADTEARIQFVRSLL